MNTEKSLKINELEVEIQNLIFQLDRFPPIGYRLTLLKNRYNHACNELNKLKKSHS